MKVGDLIKLLEQFDPDATAMVYDCGGQEDKVILGINNSPTHTPMRAERPPNVVVMHYTLGTASRSSGAAIDRDTEAGK